MYVLFYFFNEFNFEKLSSDWIVNVFLGLSFMDTPIPIDWAKSNPNVKAVDNWISFTFKSSFEITPNILLWEVMLKFTWNDTFGTQGVYQSRFWDIAWSVIKRLEFCHFDSHLITAVNQRSSVYWWLPYLILLPTLSLARYLQKTAEFLTLSYFSSQ